MERGLVTHDQKIYEYNGHYDIRSYKSVKLVQSLEDWRESRKPKDLLPPQSDRLLNTVVDYVIKNRFVV